MTPHTAIARVRELDAKATGGPWHQGTNGHTKESGLEPAFPGVHDASGRKHGEDFVVQTLGNSEECYSNSNFIAASRTLLPAFAEALDGLLKAVENQPHDVFCQWNPIGGFTEDCTCWKTSALAAATAAFAKEGM